MIGSNVEIAAQKLAQGEVVGMPTETVYGLAARIDIPEAIEKIFKTKERPFFDPLIVHVHSTEQAQTLTTMWGDVTKALAKKFWPGPLTMVLAKSDKVSDVITSGLASVGVRMPAHPVALELLRTVNIPLAAPSANKFGKTSPTSAKHVQTEFQKEDIYILEGADCEIGIESTVLLVKENPHNAELSILRAGHILQSEIEEYLELEELHFEFLTKVDKKESPGHLKHHYMPDIPLVIVNSCREEPEIVEIVNQRLQELPDVVEDVKIVKPQNGVKTFSELRLSSDPVVAARELYGKMRSVAEEGHDFIVFYKNDLHQGERWSAIFDRLNKAASLII